MKPRGHIITATESVFDGASVTYRGGRISAEAASQDGQEKGWAWDVDLIKAGISLNDWAWTESVLKAAIPMFEGCRAYAHEEGPHVDPNYRRVQDIVGWYDGVRWEDGGLRAVLHITPSESTNWLRDRLMAMAEAGRLDLIQLSVHCMTEADLAEVDTRLVWLPTSIVKVFSTDVVSEGAAGGRLVQMAASANHPHAEEIQMLKDLLEKLKASRPDLYATVDLKTATEAQVLGLIDQALTEAREAAEAKAAKQDPEPEKKEAKEAAKTPDPPAADPAKEAREAAKEATEAEGRILVREARVALAEKLSGSNLPKPAQDAIKAQFEAQFSAGIAPKPEDMDTVIKANRDMLAQIAQSAPLSIPRAEVGSEEHEKHVKAMMGLLTGKPEDNIKPFRSLRHAFSQMTGDAMPAAESVLAECRFFMPWDVAENPRAAGRYRAAMESLKTSDLGEVLGDSIRRVMVRTYNRTDLQVWRQVVSDITPINDFRTNKRVRLGGYGNLSTVAERGTYQPVTSPSDQEETYSISKKGGTEDLTLEAIANDDLRALRNIPRALALASGITLRNAVFAIFTDNSALGDSVALFHGTHSNLGSSTLSNASAMAVRQAMRDQTPYGNSTQPLGSANEPKLLLIPNELEETAWQLAQGWTRGQGEHDQTDRNANFHEGRFNYVVVDEWTDANDHYWLADPTLVPTLEVGFYQGMQEPELFVQDNPTMGSVFTSDRITYKIRHIWGIGVLEYRSMYAQKPA